MDRGLLVDMCAFLIRFLPFDVFTTLFQCCSLETIVSFVTGLGYILGYRLAQQVKGDFFPILQRLLLIANYRHRARLNFSKCRRENFCH